MKPTLIFSCLFFFFLTACSEKKESTAAEQRIYLTPEVMCGTVQFTDGCGLKTDTLIRFGIALVHHMTYEDAAYTFDKVIKEDPDCFWGHWGKAMTYIHPLWPDVPTPEEMESGYVLSQRALRLAKKDKEKLYGATIAAFYEKGPKTKAERLVDFEKAWASAHEQLPDDPEAELFHGLFLLSTVSPADKSFTVQKEVGAMAERILQKYPDHPGAFHYGIHAYDVPPLAPKALELARNYGKIAPEIPHALHMPSHIFTRLGLWQESINWNTRSVKAALKLPIEGKISPHAFHAMDYMVYAYLQFGEDAKAEEVMKGMDTLTGPLYVNAATSYALAAIPSRIPLEKHHWAEAAKIEKPDTVQFPWKKFPQYEALIYFARGIGGARSGNLDIATEAVVRLETLQTLLGESPQTKYWHDQIEIQKRAVKSWLIYAKGDKENGLMMMNYAADLEEATQKNPVSPGELLPARELLGDMLMEMNQPAEALAAYEKSLESRPNRFNTLYGAGKAAEKSGDTAKAKEYYSKLVALKGEEPSKRDEFAYAEKVVTGKK